MFCIASSVAGSTKVESLSLLRIVTFLNHIFIFHSWICQSSCGTCDYTLAKYFINFSPETNTTFNFVDCDFESYCRFVCGSVGCVR